MNAVAEQPVVDNYLEPLQECFTPEVAARILALRADQKRQDRLDELAEKNKEGTLTESERREYALMVHAGNLISVIQSLARSYLARRAA
jgi:hypothetical protein